jgi:O-antigen ligase
VTSPAITRAPLRTTTSEEGHLSSGAVSASRPGLVEVGAALVVIGCPLVFLPASAVPFVDIKTVVLLTGCVLICFGRLQLDPLFAKLGCAWFAVLVAAGLLGVDRWISLLGTDNLANGILLYGPCAYLFVVGASLPLTISPRIPAWLFRASLVSAIVAISWRFAPWTSSLLDRSLPLDGATLGSPVFLAGMTAAGAVAATAVVVRKRAWTWVGLATVSSAMAMSTKRAGLVAVGVGLAIAWLRSNHDRRQTVIASSVITGIIIFWTVVTPFVSPETPLSGVERFGELGTDSARARVVAYRVFVKASLERPLLGWGPGNTFSAYLTHATEHDLEIAQRGFEDPHNLFLDSLLTTGFIGLAVFVSLAVVVVVCSRRAGPERRWAAAVAATLFVFHLMQPTSISLTPLLFLIAGVAAARSRDSATAERTSLAAAHAIRQLVLTIALVAGLLLTLMTTASSILEAWGWSYNSLWSLRGAVALAPGRIIPIQRLVLYLAQDASSGDAAAKAEADRLTKQVVALHPLWPDARLIGVDMGLVSGDLEQARRWLRAQLTVFPADSSWISDEAIRFVEEGAPPPAVHDLVQRSGPDAEMEPR